MCVCVVELSIEERKKKERKQKKERKKEEREEGFGERRAMRSKNKGGAFDYLYIIFSFLFISPDSTLFVLLLFRILRRRCFLTHKLLFDAL